MAGKGDKRRPQLVDDDTMECNWQYAFRREEKNIQKNRYKRSKKAKNER
jgi:hypothetical protein